MSIMKKLITYTCIFTALIIFSGCQKAQESRRLKQIAISAEQPFIDLKKITPTIYLHGSGGSESDLVPFGESLAATEKKEPINLSVRVTNQDFFYSGVLTKESSDVSIFIGFENNNAPIEEWSAELARVLVDLKKYYRFEAVNLVGFSNGGLAAAYTAETLPKNDDSYPKINKLVLIGAPFNDLSPINETADFDFEEPDNQTSYLDTFLKPKDQLSDKLEVLSIAGLVSPELQSDTIVPVTSALASRLIFPDYVQYYEEQLATGEEASHLGLISVNAEVVTWVSDFLNHPTPRTPENNQLIAY